MSSSYSIIIDQGELHEDYFRDIFRDLLPGTNSTFNPLIERNKDYWYIVTEVPLGELIQNATEKYNDMVVSK